METGTNEYSLGLDIGVGSTGWAVLNDVYKLAKKGNRHLWGSNIFPEGSTAQKRRVYRQTRRLYTRKKQRIHLLQDLTSEMIYEVDPLFFKRLEYSYKVKEDKPDFYTNSLFFNDDKVFEEYKKYKTIYHLRDALTKSDDKQDPRLIYLALHHIVKYRGNFLYEGQNLDVSNSSEFDNNLKAVLQYFIDDEIVDYKKINNILLDTKTYPSKKDKVKEIGNCVNDKEYQKTIKAIGNALMGYKFNAFDLFSVDSKDKSISFKDSDIEEKKNNLEGVLSEDEYDCLEKLERCYGYLVLKQLLSHSKNGEMTLSSSMIGIYDEHHEDIKLLKTVLKNLPEEKKKIFGKGGAYDLYIHSPNKNSLDDFYKIINNLIKKHNLESEDAKRINFKIENNNFLIRQNSTDNNAIPYQLHLNELKKIIGKQKKFYPCLEKNEDKIISLVSFRIPYYIGPLDENATNAWIIKKEGANEAIRPWNWQELIDVDSTAKKFIDKMKNHCTYILSENTLPSNSILLCRFNLLNELNKIRFSDDKQYVASTIEVKNKIINDLFLKKNEVTEKDLKKWLNKNQYRSSNDNFELIGFQGDKKFASSLKSEIKFRKIYGSSFNDKQDEIEQIIEYLTVYNDKKIIERKIKSEFNLTDDQINQIVNINYKGYGRFSKKLINGILSSNSSNDVETIYELMQKSNDNFMQVLNNKAYDFEATIAELNEENKNKEITYSDVDALPMSPALKRGVWQSIRVILDVAKYMHKMPQNLYLEFARDEGEKKRTSSRYASLEKNIKELKETEAYKKISKELKDNKDNLADDRVYLYFTQFGKCMYSGKELHIDQLQNYQIDHILPRSYIADNSIENRVLVIADENQRKKDSLLLSEKIINKMKPYWEKLYENKLIGDKKLANLTRINVCNKEKENFVARQLVETRQICVHVKNLIQKYYPDINVIVVHAPLSSEFRKKFDLYKVRGINDFHHAQDAYLAAMIGQYIGKKYPSIYRSNFIELSNISDDIKERIKYEQAQLGGKESSIYSFLIQQMGDVIRYDIDGEIYWEGKEEIAYINNLFSSKDYFFNYMTRDYDGKLYNATIYPKESNAKVATKTDRPIEKYGGYDSLEKAFGLAIEYFKGKKIVRTVIDIPVVYTSSIDKYLDKLGIKNYKIVKNIQYGQIFKIDNCLYSMQSASEWQIRQPIFLGKETLNVVDDAINKKGDNSSPKELYDAVLDIIHKMRMFMPLLANQIDSLKFEELCDVFMSLSKEVQCEIIVNLVKAINKNGSSSLIFNNVKRNPFGRIYNKSLKLEETEFIYTSPSGLFKKMIKL